MNRTFTVNFNCTPTELADEFWEMSTHEQLATLHTIQKRLFVIPADGELHLVRMRNTFNANQNKEYKEEVKHFVTQLYEYLCKEE